MISVLRGGRTTNVGLQAIDTSASTTTSAESVVCCYRRRHACRDNSAARAVVRAHFFGLVILFVIRISASVICSRGIKQHFDAEYDYDHEQKHEYEL